MKLKNYLMSWEGTQAENKWGRLFLVLLLIIVLLLVIKLFTKQSIVTMQPYTLSEEAWVTKENASRSYKEAWGFAFSQLLGNVTPGSVDFVKERLSPMLSPEIYQDVIDAIEIQSKQIKEDRVTMRFEPRFVEYEEKSDKVFAYGYSYTKGASSQQEERSERTYEFVLKISNYAPSINYMETYMGKPRTQVVLEQLKRKQEEKEKRTNEAQP